MLSSRSNFGIILKEDLADQREEVNHAFHLTRDLLTAMGTPLTSQGCCGFCVFPANSALCPVNRNARNATSPLRRTGAATTWSVGTRTAKPSSAGCVWAPGSPTDLPGELRSVPCGKARKPRYKRHRFGLKSVESVSPVTGTTVIATMRMMQRQQGMHRR